MLTKRGTSLANSGFFFLILSSGTVSGASQAQDRASAPDAKDRSRAADAEDAADASYAQHGTRASYAQYGAGAEYAPHTQKTHYAVRAPHAQQAHYGLAGSTLPRCFKVHFLTQHTSLKRHVEPVYHRASGALRADGLLYRGHDLIREDLGLTLVVPGGPVDERIHTVLQGELRECLHPCRYRAFEETLAFGADVTIEVIGATDLSGFSSCSVGALVDPLVQLGKAPWRGVAERGHPAVRDPPDEVEHLRPVGADPDPDVVDGMGTGPHPLQGIKLAVEAQRTLVAPHQSHDLYGLFDGADGLAGAPARTAHADHRVPECSGPEAHLHPPSREYVEAGRRFREHGRRAQGQVGDVGEETDAFGNGHECGDEGPGVQETPLVGMVLDAHEVEARPVGGPGDACRPVGRVRQRLHANAKLEVPTVISHRSYPPICTIPPPVAVRRGSPGGTRRSLACPAARMRPRGPPGPSRPGAGRRRRRERRPVCKGGSTPLLRPAPGRPGTSRRWLARSRHRGKIASGRCQGQPRSRRMGGLPPPRSRWGR